jgi:transposase InsO family protein
VIVYIDDLLIFSESWEDHLHTLKEIFAALREFGLTLKANKCHFGCKQITFLGFIVDSDGCRPDPRKIDPIQKFPAPQNQTELRRFLGLANYYRKFIRDFSTVAAPLYELTGKGVHWNWTEKQNLAFLNLKEKLTTPTVLASPDISLPFNLYTDASGIGMGAVLMQDQGNGERVIGYASQHFTRREKNYATIEKEAAAVLWACKVFRPYLVGCEFRILSDHAPLKWLFEKQGASGRIGRWQAQLLEFEGLQGIEYLKGTDNEPADTLSRIPEILPIIKDTNTISLEDFRKKQEEDQEFDKLNKNLKLDSLWKFDGRVYIPKQLRPKVLLEYHGKGVHFGIRRTVDLIKPYFFWPKMDLDIKEYISECDICSRAKWSPIGSAIPRKSLDSTERPFKRISLDYAGPFRQSALGNKYFLVIVDDFSRFLKVYPTRDCTASTTVRCLQDLVANEGTPEEVLSDNGKHFVADLVRNFFQLHKIRHIRTAPYHPSANGMAERSIRTLKNLIRADLMERMGSDGSWDVNILRIQAAYNSAPHGVTGQSPFSIARGRTSTPAWCPVPVKVSQVNIPWNLIHGKSEVQRKQSSLKSLERKGRNMRTFEKAEEIWRRKGTGWLTGTIAEKLCHGAYRMTDGSVTHADFILRKKPEARNKENEKGEMLCK